MADILSQEEIDALLDVVEDLASNEEMIVTECKTVKSKE